MRRLAYISGVGGEGSIVRSRDPAADVPASRRHTRFAHAHVLELALTMLAEKLWESGALLVFVGVLVAVRLLQLFRELCALPPGPWGVPLIGYLPFLKGDMHLQFHDMARRYGPMFSARLGNQLVVVLSDHKTVRDAFRREEFTARPKSFVTDILDGYGVINSDGRLWKEQRRFLHERLRHFGMRYIGAGKEHMETRIMSEVESVLRTLNRSRGQPTDLNPVLGMAVSNVICDILMSVRFGREDAKFRRFTSLIDEGFRLFGRLNWVNFVPALRFLPRLAHTQQKLAKDFSFGSDVMMWTQWNRFRCSACRKEKYHPSPAWAPGCASGFRPGPKGAVAPIARQKRRV
ncbi:Cytochrome P450 18a1 [Gryllus bimaculatus]|nr:Cytochrome P450 18a1 [Gryllus bimaculatus]